MLRPLPSLLLLLALASFALAESDGDLEIKHVSYYSSFKLKSSGFFLHSQSIQYGSGSGQQAVSGIAHAGQSGSLWMLKPESASPTHKVNVGDPAKCGDIVRFEHVDTGANLHSHAFTSPLSGQQEVSGFGRRDENSDTGDRFELVCDDGGAGVSAEEMVGKMWRRDRAVTLRHVDTGKVVQVVPNKQYNDPIRGHVEVSATSNKYITAKQRWTPDDGVFFA
mmetsp:Transcript_6278/g.15281  ORF Transcript_6278/g.15281 Transcript_6278/m.15281 type:complete len:222 (-) Transcript_6278:285-950(-)